MLSGGLLLKAGPVASSIFVNQLVATNLKSSKTRFNFQFELSLAQLIPSMLCNLNIETVPALSPSQTIYQVSPGNIKRFTLLITLLLVLLSVLKLYSVLEFFLISSNISFKRKVFYNILQFTCRKKKKIHKTCKGKDETISAYNGIAKS